jgi:hypothetical protein
MITDLKLIKELKNYILKFFIQRPKDLQGYGSLYIAITTILQEVEEAQVEIAQKLIDMGIDNPLYIKEQTKWIIPEVINDQVIKLMVIDRSEYKQLSQNPIETTIDDVMKSKDTKEIKDIIKENSKKSEPSNKKEESKETKKVEESKKDVKPKEVKETKEVKEVKKTSVEVKVEDVNIDAYLKNTGDKDCNKCKKPMSECGACLSSKPEEE